MKFEHIDVNLIKYDIRTQIDENIFKSVKKVGIIFPICINEEYHVIDGVRRLIAAKRLGFKTIPCIIIKGKIS